jgi:lipopolysaccharide/colanic/teichoic acid biosynthesis glycosyltransferase
MAASAVALTALCPLFLVIGILTRCTSRGPALYWQARVGRDGKIFRIAKFRSMVVDADRSGPAITASGDSRITSFGAFLRKTKIDELPQFWNVFKGEMSIVGPRPELPQYVSGYSPSQRWVLSVRPGITDTASIRYRHEEAILAASPNPDQFYRQVVLPNKLVINLEYIRDISLRTDIVLVAQTWTSLFAQRSAVETKH